MTIDLKIHKHRLLNIIEAVSDKGKTWLVNTFTKAFNNHVQIDHEDIGDVIIKARAEGMTVDD